MSSNIREIIIITKNINYSQNYYNLKKCYIKYTNSLLEYPEKSTDSFDKLKSNLEYAATVINANEIIQEFHILLNSFYIRKYGYILNLEDMVQILEIIIDNKKGKNYINIEEFVKINLFRMYSNTDSKNYQPLTFLSSEDNSNVETYRDQLKYIEKKINLIRINGHIQ